MWLQKILFVGIISLGLNTASAQSEAIPCDLNTLYDITMLKSPTLQRQNIQYRISEVDKKSAASTFDYQLFSELSVNQSGQTLFDLDPRKDLVGNQISSNNLSLSGGVQRTFRSGMTANAGVGYNRIADNFPFNSFNENVGSFYSNNSTVVSVSVTQPLLRGRGRAVTTANEEIAKIAIESQQYNTTFISSGEIFNMAIGYWQYLGANKALEIYRSNETRVTKVLDITSELVNADKKPSSDLLQIQADLKDKERQTIQAQQQLFTARQNLGRTIGLSTVESNLIGLPANEFPKVEDLPSDIRLESLLDLAYEHRSDLKGIKKSLDIISISVDVAENMMKPQLDLTGSLSYGGVDAGNGVARFLTALGEREGRNYQVGVGLNYLFPINNNFAEANLLSNQLQYTDREIQLNNQLRNIELNVSIAYNNLLNSIEAVKKSKQSLEYYEEVFENEQYKFQTGLTTLLNLILFQERLTFAQLDYIQNQQQFAIAISNLRYETGTIFSSDFHDFMTTDASGNPEVFYTLPRE